MGNARGPQVGTGAAAPPAGAAVAATDVDPATAVAAVGAAGVAKAMGVAAAAATVPAGTHAATADAAAPETPAAAPVRVLVVGTGRMGALLASAINAAGDLELVGTVGIDNRSDLANGTAPAADLVIDFSHHEMVPLLGTYVRTHGAALVSGTTGLSADELASLAALGSVAPVVHAANYSLGIAVLRRLAATAAGALAGWDVEIVECHHNQKADAPSGTALALRAAVDPAGEAAVVNGRAGLVGARTPGEIGMHALRGGTVAGTHELLFFGDDEELALTHRATSRKIFIAGALAAARRLLGRAPGFYGFDELMFEDA